MCVTGENCDMNQKVSGAQNECKLVHRHIPEWLEGLAGVMGSCAKKIKENAESLSRSLSE